MERRRRRRTAGRVLLGAAMIHCLDPLWWQEGAAVPVDLASLDMADPDNIILGWWALHFGAQVGEDPRSWPVPPYVRAMVWLGITPAEVAASPYVTPQR